MFWNEKWVWSGEKMTLTLCNLVCVNHWISSVVKANLFLEDTSTLTCSNRYGGEVLQGSKIKSGHYITDQVQAHKFLVMIPSRIIIFDLIDIIRLATEIRKNKLSFNFWNRSFVRDEGVKIFKINFAWICNFL